MSRRFGPGWLVVAFVAGALVAVVLLALWLRLDLATSLLPAGAITTVLGTILGYYAGYLKDAQERRQRLRAVAQTLREDVHRVRAELGAPLGASDALASVAHAVATTEAKPPQIHRWFPPIIPQIAGADAAIVGKLLALDHDLHNYKAFVRQLREAQDRFGKAQQTMVDLHVQYPTPGAVPILEQKVGDEIMAARTNLEKVTERVTATYKECHKTLDDLERALGAVIA